MEQYFTSDAGSVGTELIESGSAAETELIESRTRLWGSCLEIGFLTHPGDHVAAISEATRLLAESEARLITYVEARAAEILGGAR